MPVYLDPKIFDLHYNGFCNSVLWQLFHYVPLNMDSKLSETRTLQVMFWSSKALSLLCTVVGVGMDCMHL